MKIYIEKIILINRAPFDKIELDLNENDIAVLTAINGSGKTTLLSHIVDAWHELAKPHFINEFEEKSNKFYRVSSTIHSLIYNQPSIFYIRFRTELGNIDYVDIRNTCTEEEYNACIKIDAKIPFNEIVRTLIDSNCVKQASSNFSKILAEKVFLNNIITYFPSYRFELPGYLNEPYKVNLEFKKHSGYFGYLKSPLEVVTGLPQLANWIMDIVLDMRMNLVVPDLVLFNNLNRIISQTLTSKNLGDVRFGIGQRGLGSTRIQILKTLGDQTVYPTIFNLSSGESSILCVFGELLRQADNYSNNIQLNAITGIVLIDEVDMHLHIKLQKEVLPKLLKLFPNVQFILSSHSPFLNMGLAEEAIERTKIIDLDNFGITSDPTRNELYSEVYNMMVSENNRFKERFNLLKEKILENDIPLIITEGKTDIKHLKKAKERLNIEDCNIEFFEIEGDWGDSKLKLLLEQLSKVRHTRRIIGVFDRDDQSLVSDLERGGQLFKNYSNNVFGFCIPLPLERQNYSNISIEFYYTDVEIQKENNGKRLFFDNEVDYLFNKSLNRHEINRLNEPRTERENSKKIFDEPRMCELTNWVHSKANFAQLVETNEEFIVDFDFSKFGLIFDRIRQILATPQ